MPILPVDTYVRYSAALGVGPTTEEKKEVGRLPQFFADRQGWDRFVDQIAAALGADLAGGTRVAAVFAGNYGEAGAIEQLGRSRGLPRSAATTTTGSGDRGGRTGEVLIVVSRSRERQEQRFATVEQVGETDCGDCMPYENGMSIFIGRGLKPPSLAERWPRSNTTTDGAPSRQARQDRRDRLVERRRAANVWPPILIEQRLEGAEPPLIPEAVFHRVRHVAGHQLRNDLSGGIEDERVRQQRRQRLSLLLRDRRQPAVDLVVPLVRGLVQQGLESLRACDGLVLGRERDQPPVIEYAPAQFVYAARLMTCGVEGQRVWYSAVSRLTAAAPCASTCAWRSSRRAAFARE